MRQKSLGDAQYIKLIILHESIDNILYVHVHEIVIKYIRTEGNWDGWR